MKKLIAAASLIAISCHVWAKDKIIYLGDGRHVCRGSNCEKFNAREREYQDTRARIEEQERQRNSHTGHDSSYDQRRRESSFDTGNPYVTRGSSGFDTGNPYVR